jgi:hypothetical protein
MRETDSRKVACCWKSLRSKMNDETYDPETDLWFLLDFSAEY